MRYAEKYENHFLNITAGRARFGEFATYTLNALAAPGLPKVVTDQRTPLRTVLDVFMNFVADRTGSGGGTQTQTATEDQQWELMKKFIKQTDVKLIQPAYYDDPAALKTFYPNKLGELTQANKNVRIPRFTAYVKALEAAEEKIGPEAGQEARELLTTYQTIANTKDTAESTVADLIKELGPAANDLCWALWDVHCAALHAYSRNPGRAAALFDYSLLPALSKASTKKKP